MTDAFPFEPVLRLWVLAATAIVMVVLTSVLAASHTADYLARRRERAVQRRSGAVPDVSPSPAAAPNFDPVSLPSRYQIGSRLARVHQHRSSLASNTVIVGAGGVRGKQTEGS